MQIKRRRYLHEIILNLTISVYLYLCHSKFVVSDHFGTKMGNDHNIEGNGHNSHNVVVNHNVVELEIERQESSKKTFTLSSKNWFFILACILLSLVLLLVNTLDVTTLSSPSNFTAQGAKC